MKTYNYGNDYVAERKFRKAAEARANAAAVENKSESDDAAEIQAGGDCDLAGEGGESPEDCGGTGAAEETQEAPKKKKGKKTA